MASKLFVFIEDKITGNGYTLTEVDGILLAEKLGGKTHFVHISTGGIWHWSVSEYHTGGKAGSGFTVAGAIANAKSNIEKVGDDKYASMLNEVVAQYGMANQGEIPEISILTEKEIEDELIALVPESEEDDDEW